MFITINGQLGSGKSEVCLFFKNNYGFDIFSTGKIQREYAANIGISTLELNERSKEDFSLDYFIDKSLREYANSHIEDNVIFDSRLAWHFVTNSFKVHLLVNPYVAAKRVFKNRNLKEESYANEDETLKKLIERRSLEQKRYIDVYGISMNDFSNYDLVLDTTSLSIDMVCQIISNEYKNYISGTTNKKLIVSPKNIYPTEGIRNINEKILEEYRLKVRNHIEFEPIELIRANDSLFILNGHHRVLAANLENLGHINAILLYDENDVMSMNITTKEYITITPSDIYDWEDVNGFLFNYYPEIIKDWRN